MNSQFKTERLKLTLLYYVIILVIVCIFSLIVIQVEDNQFRRFDRPPEVLQREQQENGDIVKPRFHEPSAEEKARIDAIIKDVRANNIRQILILDGIILLLSSVLSYYLAGRTLHPILAALEKQKRFVSDASHELKTPLTNMLTEAEILERSKNATMAEYQEFNKHVINDVKHLNNLVMSLLEVARVESNGTILKIKDVNIVAVIDDVLKRFKEIAAKKEVDIVVDPVQETMMAKTDQVQFERLISIFIDNAIKYNVKNGAVIITLKYTNDRKVLVEIKDTGIGIDPKSLPKIFDRFYRTSEDRNEKGFGLGLSIANGIAKILDITIRVESEVGKGSSFFLLFEQ